MSLDLTSLENFLKRFSDDPRLLLALRLSPNSRGGGGGGGGSATPLDFHQLYSSIDCLLMLYETQALQLYSKSYPQMLQLQEELCESEKILDTLGLKLGEVRGDLRRTGEKIEVVEDESSELGRRMVNRKEASVVLKTFLQQITVDRDLVRVICHGNLSRNNPAYIKALKQLTTKMEHAKQPGMQEIKSAVSSLPKQRESGRRESHQDVAFLRLIERGSGSFSSPRQEVYVHWG